MNTFTIDADNHIMAHATPEEAAATATTPFDSFSGPQELAELAKAWPPKRLLAIWNCLPGVRPIRRFKDYQAAAPRIWERIQGLAAAVSPPPAPPAPAKTARRGKGGARLAQGASAKGKAAHKATTAKSARRAKKTAPEPAPIAPRQTKTARVIAMLQRKGGATLAEIMTTMGWQKHTVRGFMAGAMKKAGYAVESFKPQGGERTYQIK